MHSQAATAEISVPRGASRFLVRRWAGTILPLLLLLCWALPAHASTAITSGQVVTGTIANGTQVDTYTFPVDVNGGGLLVGVSTDGTAGVSLQLTVFNSGGVQECNAVSSIGTANEYGVTCELPHSSVATGGTWKVTVKRSIGTVGAGYRLTLMVWTAPTAIPANNAGNISGGLMYPNVSYPGSVNRGDLQIWMAQGIKINSGSVHLTWTSGPASSQIRGFGFEPDPPAGNGGSAFASNGGPGTFTFAAVTVPAGVSALTVTKYTGADGPVNYTISISGVAAVMPTYAKADGAYSQSCNTGGTNVGDPINTATGNLFEHYTDYTTSGQNPLSLIRYYNSMSYGRNLNPTTLGVNWRTNFDRYLNLNSSVLVAAERPDGQAINFRCDVTHHTCTPDSDMDYSLSYSGSTWTLTDPDNTVETYSGSGSLGTLSSIKSRNGYTQSITYSSGQISYVSDSYGRQLGFTYTGSVVTGVTTPDSATLTYGYSTVGGQSLLSTVTYNTSPSTHVSYLYENSQLPYSLTGITDENGKRYATWTYDGSNRALSSALGGLGANQTQITYVSTGNLVTGPLGIVNTYKTTMLNNLPKLTEIDRAANGTVAAASESIRYDSNGYLDSRTDWNGNNTSWVNNSHGLPTQITYASNTTNKQVSNLTYDLTWPRLPHTIATTGLNSNFTYDSSGNMLTRKLTDVTSQSVPYSTNGQTRTWTYTYNGTGQLLSAQLPRTDVTAKTTYTYNGGTLTSITDALSHVTTITEAQGGGLPKKIRDPNGIFTTLAYNNRNWNTSSVIPTSAGNLTTSYTYDSAGNLTKTTLPDSSYLSYAYDNAHRRITTTNALSESSNITYDSGGNVTQTLWKNSSGVTKRQHTATYDALGRMLTSVGGASQTTSFTYDKNGNVLTVTDPLSNVTYISSDQLDRPYRYKDAALYTSTIAYDSHSRPLTYTDPKGNKTTYVYDGFGDTIQRNNPDTLKTIYYYDNDFNVTGINRTGIKFESATYDALDRQATRTYVNDSSLNVAIYYDSSGHGFGVGRMTGGTDATGSFSRSYDERGNITADAKTIAGHTWTGNYSYDSASRFSTITYASSGWKVAYTRDSAGQITSVTDTQPGHAATNLATSITHMPFGPASSWTYGNGVTDARTFDLDYRMTSVTDHGTSNIQYVSYSWDADNNLHVLTDNVTPGNSITLTYDAVNRLVHAGGSITYDSNSNVLTVGGVTNTVPAGSDLISVSNGGNYSYDSAGNLTQVACCATQTYSQANRLATASGYSYAYDAFNQRLKTKATGTPFAVYMYDLNGHLLSETNSGTETDYVYLDGMPLSVIQPGAATVSALHTDHLGTVQAATSSTKSVVWECAYSGFGACTPSPATITQNLRFPGMYADGSGYYYNINRYYYPGDNNGRYIQPDPLGLLGPQTPNSNPFPYAGMNPYTYDDPLGLNQDTVTTPIGTVTGGTNSGQTNIGGVLGVSEGFAHINDPNDRACVYQNEQTAIYGQITGGGYFGSVHGDIYNGEYTFDEGGNTFIDWSNSLQFHDNSFFNGEDTLSGEFMRKSGSVTISWNHNFPHIQIGTEEPITAKGVSASLGWELRTNFNPCVPYCPTGKCFGNTGSQRVQPTEPEGSSSSGSGDASSNAPNP
jgi:RHS repeat-associated protein